MLNVNEKDDIEIGNRLSELEKKLIKIENRLSKIEAILKITNSVSDVHQNTLDTLAEKLNINSKDLAKIFDLHKGELLVIHKFPKEMSINERTQNTLILLLFGFEKILGLSEVHSKIIRQNLDLLEIDKHNLERNIEDIIPNIIIKIKGGDSKNLYRLTDNGKLEAENLVINIIGELSKNA